MNNDRDPTESHLNREYGKGFNMLKKMGFKSGGGLGPCGEGITAPIEVAPRKPGEGLRDDEGLVMKPPSAVQKRGRALKRRQTPDSDREEMPDEDSSGSELEAAEVVELSEEEKRVVEARREVEILLEKKRELEYQVFNVSSLLEGGSDSIVSAESISALSYDIVDSGILHQSLRDASVLARVISLLRDKYDSNPLWSELQAELVISAAVSEMVHEITEKVEVTPSLVEAVHDLVIDDDHFARLLEFQLIPAPALKPDRTIFEAIKSSASCLHYQSIYSRLLEKYIQKSLVDHQLTSWLVREGWIDLVPRGSTYDELMEEYVVPQLSRVSDPQDILPWRAHLSEEQWKRLVTLKSNQLLVSLRKVSPGQPDAVPRIKVAVGWSSVVSPCVVGFLLAESGFLPKWLDLNKLEPDILKKECQAWCPILVNVAYHSPAKKIVQDAVKIATAGGELDNNAKRRPPGPPREFFTLGKSTAGSCTKIVTTLGDVIREEASARNLLVAPKPGTARENGIQVFKIGDKSFYWKEDSIYILTDQQVWIESSLESLFR